MGPSLPTELQMESGEGQSWPSVGDPTVIPPDSNGPFKPVLTHSPC